MQIQKYFGLLLPVVMTCAGADIVTQGKPAADIVISENADAGTIIAAKDLQSHLLKISGARLAIVTPSASKAGTLLCVGESSASKKAGYSAPAFSSSGYDIWVKGNCIVLNGPVTLHSKEVISGKLHPNSALSTVTSPLAKNPALNISLADDHGTMHAVSAFLEHLGVRFYSPYKNGTIIPEMKDIRVGDFRETRQAAFARREFQIGKAQECDEEAVLWFKRLKTGSALPKTGVLAIADIVRAGEKAHPEWAAKDRFGNNLLTGDGCVFPRLKEKSLQKEIVKAALKYFETHPETESLHIVQPALRAVGDFAELNRENPKNTYPYTTDLVISANAYSDMAKEIAKKYPGKKILWQGTPGKGTPSHGDYTGTAGVVPPAISPLSYAHSGNRRKYLTQLPKYSKMFAPTRLEQREWWNEFSCPDVIRQGYTFPRKLQMVRKAQKGVISGFLMDAAVDAKTQRLAEVPLMHFMYYVNSKLLWDPDLDLAALTKEFCTHWFGPAADEMNAFMNCLESIADRPLSRSISKISGQLQEKDLPVIFELLNKAAVKVPEKSIFAQRILAIRRSLLPLAGAFVRRTPRGRAISSEILPWDQQLDGNLKKYRTWRTLSAPEGAPRTEFAVAFSEDRSRLLFAFRCFEPEMKKIKAAATELDDCKIFADDHIRIDFNTPNKNAFVFAVNSAGVFLDGSSDPDELLNYGSLTGRDKERSMTFAKRFDDRWEVECAIDITLCGKSPDWNPDWGLNVTRVRQVSGKPETFALVRNAAKSPSRWRKLTLDCRDTKGRKVWQYNNPLLLLPGHKAEETYTVKRAGGKVSLSDPWNEKSWKDIPELRLGWESVYFDRSSGFRPDARAKFQYDDKYIYVLYQVKDQAVRGTFKEDQQMVCLDSCMEFFVQPDPAGPYYNFECNCIGTLLLYEIHVSGDKKTMAPIPGDELKTIKRFSSLPRDIKGELSGPVTWYLGLQIPIEMFSRRTGVSADLSGQMWNANVYKCADWTSKPCWLQWHKTYTFHNPEGFGRFIFE